MAKSNKNDSGSAGGGSKRGAAVASNVGVQAGQIGWALMLVAGIAAVGAFATLFAVWMRTKTPGSADQLRIAMDEYVAGRHEIAERLADSVAVDAEKQPELDHLRTFLLGASGLSQAIKIEDAQEMRKRIAETAPLLERLDKSGFPPGRSAEGRRLLGLALNAAGRFEDAIIPMEEAMEENPIYERELLLPLAAAKLRATGVKADRAMEDIGRFLSLPNLPKTLLDDAAILKARANTALGLWEGVGEALADVNPETHQDQRDLTLALSYIAQAREVLKEQAILAGSEERKVLPKGTQDDSEMPRREIPLVAKELLSEAISLMDELNHRNDLDWGATTKYLTGIAYRLAGRDKDALGVLASLRQNTKHPAEAVAAGIEEVELLAETGHFRDAVMAAKAIVRDTVDPIAFDPKWISLPEFRTRLENAAQVMLAGEGYEHAIEFAKILPPMVDPTEALRLEAVSYMDWAKSLEKSPRPPIPSEAAERLSQIRAKYRQAGTKYQQVAKLQFAEPEYIDLTWQAIDAYQAGRSYEESLALLDEYLTYEERSRRPRGLLAQGRALLSLDRPKEALRPLMDLIEEYPRDSLRYEARLLSAIARGELDEVELPRKLLEQNLEDEMLSPQSPVFRDSLFVLGELLYRKALRQHLEVTAPKTLVGRISPGDQPSSELSQALEANQEVLKLAIERLRQAQHRDRSYDNESRARRATYLFAEANRLASFWPSIQAADPDTIDTARRQKEKERKDYLNEAHTSFAALRKELASIVSERSELLPWEQAMLRNSFMGVADTLFELEEYGLAADAYQTASQEYLNEPLALEALLQQSRCYDQLGRTAEAKRIFQQASKVLDRLPVETEPTFAETTRYDRADWQSLLNWLQKT